MIPEDYNDPLEGRVYIPELEMGLRCGEGANPREWKMLKHLPKVAWSLERAPYQRQLLLIVRAPGGWGFKCILDRYPIDLVLQPVKDAAQRVGLADDFPRVYHDGDGVPDLDQVLEILYGLWSISDMWFRVRPVRTQDFPRKTLWFDSISIMDPRYLYQR